MANRSGSSIRGKTTGADLNSGEYSDADYLARVWIMAKYFPDINKVPPLMRLTKSDDAPMMMGEDPKWEIVKGHRYFMGSTKRIIVGAIWLFDNLPESMHFPWMNEIMEKIAEDHRAMLGVEAKP